jgi:undecaprenyl-diphosphatase
VATTVFRSSIAGTCVMPSWSLPPGAGSESGMTCMADPVRPAAVFRWLERHEIGFLVALVISTIGLWVFAELADAVVENETHAFDRAVILAMRDASDAGDPLGPRWFEELVRDVTALGGTAIVALVTFIGMGYALLRRASGMALAMSVAAIGAESGSSVIKLVFDRPRPELVPAFAHAYSASFPSGHAMVSAAVYLTLALQLARTHSDAMSRGYFFAIALVLVLAIGTSRVYLGLHWPTDVLAGWAAGTSWALVVDASARFVERRLERRRTSE